MLLHKFFSVYYGGFVFCFADGAGTSILYTGDYFFECRLELIKAITQVYYEVFKSSFVPKRDERFFLCEQMLDLLHCFSGRFVKRDSLPEEKNWEPTLFFLFCISWFSRCAFLSGEKRASSKGHDCGQVQT